MKLFCFAHAGGTAASFGSIIKRVDGCALVPVERSGHGTRLAEPLLESMEDYVQDAIEQMAPAMDEPFGLLGHSMGAWQAYEVAAALHRTGQPRPSVLVVSGNTRPRTVAKPDTVEPLDDRAFLDSVKDYASIPAEILLRPEFRRVFFDPLRSDFGILDRYVCREMTVLECPIIALYGSADPLTASGGTDWRSLTTGLCEECTFMGDHFFFYESEEVPHYLAGRLNERELAVC